MNLRSDRVAQSGEVEVGVERGVDLDAAVHDALLSSLNGGLGVGGSVLVIVLVGHDADAALCEAELNFGERELMKIVLKKIRGTDVELLLKESGLIE